MSLKFNFTHWRKKLRQTFEVSHAFDMSNMSSDVMDYLDILHLAAPEMFKVENQKNVLI